MKLTVGFATYADRYGTFATLANLFTTHKGDFDEIVIIDNAPEFPESQDIQHLASKVGAKYVQFAEVKGTSVPRNKVFEHATGDIVVCVDSHVALAAGSLKRIKEFYSNPEHEKDLLHGVICHEDLSPLASHYDDCWSYECWGTWSLDPRAEDPDGEPFQIYASGFGLFACMKKHWLGFHPLARGFGGEEWCYHIKHMRSGGRIMCHPGVRYIHDFGKRPRQYPFSLFDKVRNYLLWLTELNLPEVIQRCRAHFVDGVAERRADGTLAERPVNRVPAELFDAILEDPVNATPASVREKLKSRAQHSPQQPEPNRIPLSAYVPEILKHDETLAIARQYLDGAQVVYEMGHAPIGIAPVALNTDRTIHVVVCNPQVPFWSTVVTDIPPNATWSFAQSDPRRHVMAEEADILYIDIIPDGTALYDILAQNAHLVRHLIMIAGTEMYAESGLRTPDGKVFLGLRPAIRRFVSEFRNWTVIQHHKTQYGLTVLSCKNEDKKQLPSLTQMAVNFVSAMAKHVASGGGLVSPDVLEKRLGYCWMCPSRNNERCGECGCYLINHPSGLPGKAQLKSSTCPLGYWVAEK